MKANEKLVWGALTGSALLIPIILALVMDSPWYLLLIVALLAVIGALWFFRDGRWEAASTSAPPSREREPAQAAEPLLEEVLTEVELPTARPDYAVIFSARVNWQPIPQPVDEPPHADLAAVARHAVIERAASFVRDREPSDLGVARSALDDQFQGFSGHRRSGIA